MQIVQSPEIRDPESCTAAALPITEVLARLGGKWTILVIGALSPGPLRFSELRRRIESISQKMLTATLRDLEADGFVTRTVTPTIPPRVDYELTDLGHELQQPLDAISRWAHANRPRMEAARAQHATRLAAERDCDWAMRRRAG
ncbi:MAG: HxlR type helix-turn-helix-domain containing protein [Devosia sp.]|nr:HxlR type helix-turn-helix-domain containing protein [Devosia sp.]